MDGIPRTVRGRIARMDELTETKTGRKVLRFAVAENSSYVNGEGKRIDRETVFTRCEAWNGIAERIVDQLAVGVPVVFVGDARARTYETEDKQKRTTQWTAVFAGGKDLGVKPTEPSAEDDETSEQSESTTTDAAGTSDPYDE